MARPRPAARYVTFFSLEEPYVDQISMAQFTLPDVMVARTMDGRPISRDHGAPLRLSIPTKIGYKQAKYLTRLSVTNVLQAKGYWEDQGYSEFYGL